MEVSELGIDGILKVLPHRFPMLLVDRVLEIKTNGPVHLGMKDPELSAARTGTYARTIKNISMNDIHFTGHFPDHPIFPGVLTIEAMAQSAVFATVPFIAATNAGILPPLHVALGSIDDVRFRKPIVPGDQLQIKVTITNVRGAIWGFEGEATVDGKRAAEAKFLAYLGKKEGNE